MFVTKTLFDCGSFQVFKLWSFSIEFWILMFDIFIRRIVVYYLDKMMTFMKFKYKFCYLRWAFGSVLLISFMSRCYDVFIAFWFPWSMVPLIYVVSFSFHDSRFTIAISKIYAVKHFPVVWSKWRQEHR